ncbi:hypothetical protein [Peptoanaerobacter stomatis]|uniref:hypothetical protein n=1 Tax=Peptoanaerobacter stomatis TaxID=796937 RepID=UPI003FA146F9
MCRISEMLREEGRLEGDEKGIQNIIEVYRNELFLDKEEILSRIKTKFDLTYDNAQSYVDDKSEKYLDIKNRSYL